MAGRVFSVLSSVGLLLAALVLGWQGLPAVSSQGMMIRSFLIEGDVPVTPVDPRAGIASLLWSSH